MYDELTLEPPTTRCCLLTGEREGDLRQESRSGDSCWDTEVCAGRVVQTTHSLYLRVVRLTIAGHHRPARHVGCVDRGPGEVSVGRTSVFT